MSNISKLFCPGFPLGLYGSSLLKWSEGTFVNASGERGFWLSSEETVTGPYGVNEPAIRRIGSVQYIQLEGSRTNECLQSETLDIDGVGDPWLEELGGTVTADQENYPGGGLTADIVTFTAAEDSGLSQDFVNAEFTDNINSVVSLFHRREGSSYDWRLRSINKANSTNTQNITSNNNWSRGYLSFSMGSGATDPQYLISNGV